MEKILWWVANKLLDVARWWLHSVVAGYYGEEIEEYDKEEAEGDGTE